MEWNCSGCAGPADPAQGVQGVHGCAVTQNEDRERGETWKTEESGYSQVKVSEDYTGSQNYRTVHTHTPTPTPPPFSFIVELRRTVHAAALTFNTLTL